MRQHGELFEDPGKPQLDKRAAAKVLGVVFAVFFIVWLGSLTGNDDSAPSRSPANEDSNSGLACRHFRNIAGDADVLSDAEIREKLKEVHDNASIATPQVQAASRQALSAITSGDIASFETAIANLSQACTAAGY